MDRVHCEENQLKYLCLHVISIDESNVLHISHVKTKKSAFSTKIQGNAKISRKTNVCETTNDKAKSSKCVYVCLRGVNILCSTNMFIFISCAHILYKTQNNIYSFVPKLNRARFKPHQTHMRVDFAIFISVLQP